MNNTLVQYIYDIKDPTLIDYFITDRILSVLDVHAPILSFSSGGGKNGNKNLSKECLFRIKNRNKLRRKARRSNLKEDWDTWKLEKNRVNNLLRYETKQIDKIEQLTAQDDIPGKQLWKRVKNMTGHITFPN